MGTYNTYFDGEISVQLKVGDTDEMNDYTIGNICDLADGVYVGYEGAVAVKNSKVVLVTNNLQDKYGGEISCRELVEPNNPVFSTIQKFKKEVGTSE